MSSNDPAASAASPLVIASHANHYDTDYGALGIASVRMEPVDVELLDNVIYFSPRPMDPDESSVVVLLVIDRLMKGTSDVLTHAYSPSQLVIEYLASSDLPILREDAALLTFATSSFAKRGLIERAMRLRSVESVENENRLLKEALNIPPSTRVTPQILQSVALASSQRSGSRPGTVPTDVSGEGGGAQRRSPRPQTTNQKLRSTSNQTPGVIEDPSDLTRPPLHSPLQWDTETEAAINARTKYQAFNSKYEPPPRLDKITQEHLCVRLHDKSMDQKKRRLAEIEEQVMRSLGQQERRVLTPDEIHELGARLHDKQRENTKKTMEKLRAQYLPQVPRRALTPDVMKASASRLHDETMARAKKNLDELVQHYVYERDPPVKKLDKKTMEEMASRLCAPKAA